MGGAGARCRLNRSAGSGRAAWSREQRAVAIKRCSRPHRHCGLLPRQVHWLLLAAAALSTGLRGRSSVRARWLRPPRASTAGDVAHGVDATTVFCVMFEEAIVSAWSRAGHSSDCRRGTPVSVTPTLSVALQLSVILLCVHGCCEIRCGRRVLSGSDSGRYKSPRRFGPSRQWA
jgi:hypothetical protein